MALKASMVEPIYHGNDYRVAVGVEAPDDTSDGEDAPTSNLVLNIRLSYTQDDPLIPDSGTAIHADLNKSAPELPGKPGTYACIFEGSDIDAHISESVRYVYVIVEAGVGDILCNDRVPVRRIRKAA